MNDVLDSLKETVRERLNSPLIGPYFFAFMACNYKALLYMFSGLSPQEKIAAIDLLYSSDNALLEAFGLPLAIALFYIFLYPFPARMIMRFTLYQNRLNRNIRHQVLEETVLTLEESRALVSRHKEELAELEKESTNYQRQVERWKTEAATKEQEVSELKGIISDRELKISALSGHLSTYGAQLKNIEAAVRDFESLKGQIEGLVAEESDKMKSAGRGIGPGPYAVHGPEGTDAYKMSRGGERLYTMDERLATLKPLLEKIQKAIGDMQSIKKKDNSY